MSKYTSPEYILEFLERNGSANLMMLSDWLCYCEIEEAQRTGVFEDPFFGDRFDASLRQLEEKGLIRYRRGNNPLYLKVYPTYGKDEIPMTLFTWNAAMDWARERGVPLKKGKITKETAHLRIYEYGLMDDFNRAWPEYQFHVTSLEEARLRQEARTSRAKRAAYLRKKYGEGPL